MHSDRFEYEFSKFLDRHEYDEAENYLFSMVRLAFAAGWEAAGGEKPSLSRFPPFSAASGSCPLKPAGRTAFSGCAACFSAVLPLYRTRGFKRLPYAEEVPRPGDLLFSFRCQLR